LILLREDESILRIICDIKVQDFAVIGGWENALGAEIITLLHRRRT